MVVLILVPFVILTYEFILFGSLETNICALIRVSLYFVVASPFLSTFQVEIGVEFIVLETH